MSQLAAVPAFTAAGLALVAALGLVVGSFLNVVIHRVPRGESVVRPRSRCPGCRQTIAGYDNIPLISWLLLRGKCRRCASPISLRYPLVEAFTGAVFVAIAVAHGASALTLLWWAFAAGLIVAAGIDLDERWIPDSISLGGLAAGLALVPAARALAGEPYAAALAESALGAAIGGGALWLVGFLHARVSQLLGREFEHWPGEGNALPTIGTLDYWTWFPGLGFGDVKLMAAVGAFLGPLGAAHTIVLAAVFGVLLGLAPLVVARRSLDSPFGFGPAIALAAMVACVTPRLLL
ncbi:MAG TPA: prepilin peptidase [Myxococcota bacterium]|jgi:leader peptidase (prepilin peptidase)/N-methyltransferase